MGSPREASPKRTFFFPTPFYGGDPNARLNAILGGVHGPPGEKIDLADSENRPPHARFRLFSMFRKFITGVKISIFQDPYGAIFNIQDSGFQVY